MARSHRPVTSCEQIEAKSCTRSDRSSGSVGTNDDGYFGSQEEFCDVMIHQNKVVVRRTLKLRKCRKSSFGGIYITERVFALSLS